MIQMGRSVVALSVLLLVLAISCSAAVHPGPAPTAAAAGAGSPATRAPRALVTPAASLTPSAVLPSIAADPVPTSAATPPSAGSGACGTDFPPGDTVEWVESGGNWRSFLLHVPEGYSSARPHPVVFSFHGYGRSASAQHDYTGLWRLADRFGFILIEPEGWGSPQEWDLAGDYYYDGIDDLIFTTDILHQVETQLCVDPVRVYATGFSNGAEMASLVGCRLGDVFAAIAPVSGVEYDGDCVDRPVPVLSFQGTDDWNVFFDDAPPAMAAWAAHNGCGDTQVTTDVSASVSAQEYEGCGAAPVILYVIEGGGHTWPGAADDAGDIGGIGFTTHDIDANELMWQFFEAHPLPS